MSNLIPLDYVIQNFYTYCRRPVYRKSQGIYNAECCVCNEGKKSGRSRRLFYFPDKRYFYCHNCCKSWKEMEWLQLVCNKNYTQIIADTKNFYTEIQPTIFNDTQPIIEEQPEKDLPDNCIDLEDLQQIEFYSKNSKTHKTVLHAREYCISRRLFTSVNRCKHYYVSINDKTHHNRLVIPFYNNQNKVECYQTRALFDNQFPKYITKVGEKCLYGENTLDNNVPYIFIFEGPIDSMFVKNGVAMAGTDLSNKQQSFIDSCIGFEKIFVYDNDTDNKQLARKINNKLKQNQKVFIWPEKFSKFKDINEVCCKLKIDEFNWKFIVDNSFSGTEGVVKRVLSCS